ncbi:hypothetical protein FOQG_11879 [Fusarium oxysporum f. sp. raphani 54005]|uniref:Uncharacterized protein n=2 Tax=Fusarium oxysporum f. sp. raphani TaxID=96318 RepID=X0CN02_FUSOX|nr:hypothetical protein FOQG_11879 [Fusarium oxysporum f. sp. raphani 54005]KAG7425921.1 hypothetical protein Forpi1262_v012426 [Fusarium oxysporum f. sp. raphani]KAJ4055808.1 hypothetical protein NW753_006572 [Fusarium oxysporum]WKT53015.1 hypothetical protein QSH57_003577 [Fusarium oxysporum f. sp. vasinfectum]KAJ4061608.1 hypothetical protein NW763_004997 [Fusarium oxysporum]
MSEKTKSAFFDYTEASSAAPPPFSQAVSNAGPSTFQSRFASITRHGLDRIRLVNFSEAEIAAVHEIVRTYWDRGIDKVYPQEASREFKLGGYAWGYDPNGNEQAMMLTLRILEGMHNLGWVIYSPIEVTKRVSTKDALIFRKVNHIPPPCEWINVSFHGGDKLKILNFPPSDLVNDIMATFMIDIQRHEVTPDRAKIKFKGYPWRPLESDGAETQLKLLALLEILERHGFTLYARTSARFTDETSESNVLVFQRRRDWVAGKSLYDQL